MRAAAPTRPAARSTYRSCWPRTSSSAAIAPMRATMGRPPGRRSKELLGGSNTGRRRVRLRHGRGRSDLRPAARGRPKSCCRDDCYQAVVGLAAAGAGASVAGRSPDCTRRHRRLAAGRGARRPALARVAVEPALAGRRPAGDPAHPRKPGRIARRRQHLRDTARAAAAGARRRPRPPLGDEIPRRPLRPDCLARGRSRRRRSQDDSASDDSSPEPSPARSRPTSPFAACAHCTCASNAQPPPRTSSPRGWNAHPDVSDRPLPGPAHAPDARDCAPLHAQLRSNDLLRRPRRRSRADASATACRSSGTPPVSAPSSRPSNAAPPSPASSTCHRAATAQRRLRARRRPLVRPRQRAPHSRPRPIVDPKTSARRRTGETCARPELARARPFVKMKVVDG